MSELLNIAAEDGEQPLLNQCESIHSGPEGERHASLGVWLGGLILGVNVEGMV